MSVRRNLNDLYVVIGAGDQKFAIPVQYVREMVPMPPVVKVPRAPEYVRGVINLRDQVLPLVDLRVQLGMNSCQSESQALIEMLGQREEDHRRWLEELRAAVEEGREFSLARDPHKCAFGKWYYAYDAHTGLSRCLALDMILVKFEAPHNRIHAVADQALDLAAAGDRRAAVALIEQTRNSTLSEMIELFAQARTTITQSRRELAVVLSENGKTVALSVDLAESVEMVERGQSKDLSQVRQLGLDRGLVTGFGRLKKDQGLIMLLDAAGLLDLF